MNCNIRSLRNFFLLIFVCFILFVSAEQEHGPGGKRTLAILGDLKIKSTHSKFFHNLEGNFSKKIKLKNPFFKKNYFYRKWI